MKKLSFAVMGFALVQLLPSLSSAAAFASFATCTETDDKTSTFTLLQGVQDPTTGLLIISVPAGPDAIAGTSAETVTMVTKDKSTVVTLPADSIFGSVFGKSEIDLSTDGPVVVKGTYRSYSCAIDQ